MSTIAFASLTNTREQSDPSRPTEARQPGMNKAIDAIAALVPAEVLALHSILLTFTTETQQSANRPNEIILTVTDPTTLMWSFWAMVGLSGLIFFIGRDRKNQDRFDMLRLMVPPCAFVVWTMLQKGSAFDAVFPHIAMAPRMASALFAATLLGILVTWLASMADAKMPKE